MNKKKLINQINIYRSVLILLVICVFATILSPSFLSVTNLFNVFKQITVAGKNTMEKYCISLDWLQVCGYSQKLALLNNPPASVGRAIFNMPGHPQHRKQTVFCKAPSWRTAFTAI